MHVILNFRSPQRAVNKYEMKCLSQMLRHGREWNSDIHIIRCWQPSEGGSKTGVARQYHIICGPGQNKQHWRKNPLLEKNHVSLHQSDKFDQNK